MSWWVYLEENGDPVAVANHSEGGTYAIGGIERAELNVTYNYGVCFHLAGIDGFRETLDGQKAADVTPALQSAVEKLGTQQYKDYWAPTPGNAGHALNILLQWAEQYPDAVFKVS
jgi:hypothetical protein